jgi:hypothetical protein
VGGAWFVKVVRGASVVVCGLHMKEGGEWVCGDLWKGKWAMWTMRFDETWWTKGHGTFCAHEERSLLGAQLQIGPTLEKFPTFPQQF